jgi:hypothetical protein
MPLVIKTYFQVVEVDETQAKCTLLDIDDQPIGHGLFRARESSRDCHPIGDLPEYQA